MRKLNEKEYRKWMVLIAAGTLTVAAIRLLIGGSPRKEVDPAERQLRRVFFRVRTLNDWNYRKQKMMGIPY